VYFSLFYLKEEISLSLFLGRCLVPR